MNFKLSFCHGAIWCWRSANGAHILPIVMHRRLLASIHDVSPRFETEVDCLLDRLAPHVGPRIALLVVPNHWGSAPVVAGSPFATRIRRWAEAGMEIFLHGLVHRDDTRHERSAAWKARFMTAGEGEFLGLERAEAASRIRSGSMLIEDIIGRSIDGFVAPAWLYGSGARQALRECGIPIAEDHFRVWSPATGKQLARGPAITWASRTTFRLASSVAAAAAIRRLPLRVLRIGVHPPDVGHPLLLTSIDAALAAALERRVAGSYGELLRIAEFRTAA